MKPILPILFLATALLTGCVRPQETILPPGKPGAVYTAAAQTASVYSLPDVLPGTQESDLTLTPEQISNPVTPVPGPTREAAGEDSSCDRVKFIKDVTIPDDFELKPGEEFTKTWRLENAGSCTWSIGYVLLFDKGDSLGAPATVLLTNKPVPPGETIDVSVDFQAPQEIGSYQGYWKIRNVKGETFGLGEFSQPFWVKINVVKGGGTMFDFNARAAEGAWGSGSIPVSYEEVGETIVYFDRNLSDEDPFAGLKADQPLEGGRQSGTLLLVRPRPEAGSYLVGRFPDYTVNAADLMFGRVGLITRSNGSCGAGELDFLIRLMIKDDPETLTTLWEGNQNCDGRMQSFEIDLNAYQGETVQIYLTVISRNDSSDNYGVWDSLAIRR